MWHFSGGIDHPRGTDRQQQVARLGSGEGGAQRIARQALAEPDHAWPQASATVAAARRFETTSGFGFVRCGQRLGRFTGAGEAAWPVQAAVQMDHLAAAGAFVQVVDVLRDQRQLRHMAGEFGDGHVRGVRPSLENLHPAPLVPAPDQRRVATKGVGSGQFARIETLPQAGERIAKGRDAALGGDAGTGEHHDMARRTQGAEQGRGDHGRLRWLAGRSSIAPCDGLAKGCAAPIAGRVATVRLLAGPICHLLDGRQSRLAPLPDDAEYARFEGGRRLCLAQ